MTLPPKRLRKFHGKSEIMFSDIKEEISSAADGYHCWPIELHEAPVKSASTNQNSDPHQQCLLLKNEFKNCRGKCSPKIITFIKRAVSQNTY